MTVQELYQQIDGDYEAAKRVMMMDQMISRFIVKFLDDKTYDRLMAAGESMDPAALFEAAHTLKGVAANLGLTKIGALSSEVTEEFRPGKERTMGDETVKAKLAEISALYAKAVEGIRAFAQNG